MRHKGLPRSRELVGGTRGTDLAELAERQHGVVSIRQLERLGYSRNAVGREMAAGRLHRLYRGVYAVGHRHLTAQGRCLAAVLACGRGALLSHGSAAWLRGISRHGPAPVAVTTPLPRKPRPPIRLHHSRVLTDEDRALVEGIPVTALPRTLLDLAATVRLSRLERSFERAEELELFDLRRMEALLGRTAGHPGHGQLRRALALMLIDVELTRVTDRRLEREPEQVIARVGSLLEKRRGEMRLRGRC